MGSMVLAAEQISKDGTLKRSYELSDGQLIEVGLNYPINITSETSSPIPQLQP